VGLPASTVAGSPALLALNPLPSGKRARWPVTPRGQERIGLDRGSKLRCTIALGGSKGRRFQRLQITIDPLLRPFVPFCSQFSFQLCSRVTTLVPAREEVGLVGINETCSLSFPASVGDVSSSDPPLKSSLAHTRASWQSHRSSRLVFAVPRCVHTEPFARLDGPAAPVGRLVFEQDAILLHDEARQASWRAAPRHMRSDS